MIVRGEGKVEKMLVGLRFSEPALNEACKADETNSTFNGLVKLTLEGAAGGGLHVLEDGAHEVGAAR